MWSKYVIEFNIKKIGYILQIVSDLIYFTHTNYISTENLKSFQVSNSLINN